MIYPAGRYNLNFDICSICLCIFILIFFLTKKNLHFRRIRAFFMVAVLMLFCSAGELVMDITRNSNGIIFQNWQAELATFFSHIAYNSIPYVLTLYFLTITGLRYGMTRRRFLLMSAPECALILMHLIPPVRRLIYNYSGNCLYARGPLYDIYYVISAFYICYSAAVLIIHFDAIPKKDRVYVLVLCGGFITSMIIGALNPYLKATNFLQSLFMIGSFFALENDEALIDSSTRIYNTTAMIRDAYGMDFVEVNLSTIQCMDKNLVKNLQNIMEKYGICSHQIVLEITESAVIHNEERMKQVIGELQKAGFSFALDDFGTGHANYSYVLNFPFRIIKIDKHFLWSADESENNQAIFRNMLHLAKDLRLKAVVEGVETKEQRDELVQAGVSYLQGFYYSKPVPEQEFLRYIQTFNA